MQEHMVALTQLDIEVRGHYRPYKLKLRVLK